MGFIALTEQSGSGACSDINSVTAQSGSYIRINMLIKVEANFIHGNRVSVASTGKGRCRESPAQLRLNALSFS